MGSSQRLGTSCRPAVLLCPFPAIRPSSSSRSPCSTANFGHSRRNGIRGCVNTRKRTRTPPNLAGPATTTAAPSYAWFRFTRLSSLSVSRAWPAFVTLGQQWLWITCPERNGGFAGISRQPESRSQAGDGSDMGRFAGSPSSLTDPAERWPTGTSPENRWYGPDDKGSVIT